MIVEVALEQFAKAFAAQLILILVVMKRALESSPGTFYIYIVVGTILSQVAVLLVLNISLQGVI